MVTIRAIIFWVFRLGTIILFLNNTFVRVSAMLRKSNRYIFGAPRFKLGAAGCEAKMYQGFLLIKMQFVYT